MDADELLDDDELTEEEDLHDPPYTRVDMLKQAVFGWILPLCGVLVAVHLFGMFRAPDLPDAAPSFALQDLSGETVELADFAGQTVVLNFWATWCGPCRVEAPMLSSFADANPDVPVLGIAADGPASKLKAHSKKLGITYEVLQGDRQTLRAYGITTYPTTVVVGPDGRIKRAYTGLVTRPQLSLLTR